MKLDQLHPSIHNQCSFFLYQWGQTWCSIPPKNPRLTNGQHVGLIPGVGDVPDEGETCIHLAGAVAKERTMGGLGDGWQRRIYSNIICQRWSLGSCLDIQDIAGTWKIHRGSNRIINENEIN